MCTVHTSFLPEPETLDSDFNERTSDIRPFPRTSTAVESTQYFPRFLNISASSLLLPLDTQTPGQLPLLSEPHHLPPVTPVRVLSDRAKGSDRPMISEPLNRSPVTVGDFPKFVFSVLV